MESILDKYGKPIYNISIRRDFKDNIEINVLDNSILIFIFAPSIEKANELYQEAVIKLPEELYKREQGPE